VSEPARWGRRRRALDVLDRVHLARPAVRAYELLLAARSGGEEASDDGLPLPPARLRTQVGPLHADPQFFLESGRHHADLIRDLLEEAGSAVDELGALLDWGCGCGRVLRHWSLLRATRVHGCDIDARMIAWCADNLPFAAVRVTALEPPLPYDDDTFGLVYAFSVFTHLSEDLQHAWIADCRRVVAPGGFLLLSTLGEHYASRERLTPPELRQFEEGRLVVLYERSAGTSLCSAYHPPRYVHETLARGFDVAAFRPAGDDGLHDLHLLRKQ
jgi:SAM-dependent methyltransferase